MLELKVGLKQDFLRAFDLRLISPCWLAVKDIHVFTMTHQSNCNYVL